MNEELLAAHELILDAITPGPWAIEPGWAAPAWDPDMTCIRWWRLNPTRSPAFARRWSPPTLRGPSPTARSRTD